MSGKGEPPLTPAQEAADIRRLNAALGITPKANLVGLALALGIAALVSFAIYALRYGGGPPTRVYGTVTGFGLAESQYGTQALVRVRVDDREGMVPIGRGVPCRVGDRIPLDRRAGPLGAYRYSVTLAGCEEPR